MPPMTLILAVGQDPTLLDSRNAILRAAGYTVAPSLSIQHAIDQFRAGDFDLVVLCHSMHPDDRQRLTSLIRASGSQTPVLSVVAISGHDPDAFADAVLPSDPRDFLRDLHDVLQKTKRNRHLEHADPHPNATSARSLRTILCIDDDRNLLAARRKILEDAGYFVLTAQSAAQGFAVFSTGIVDLAILDYAMAAMNGGVLAALMRQSGRKIPLILNSALSSIPAEARALFDRVVPRGLPPSVLLSAIEECCCGDQPKGKESSAHPPERRSGAATPPHPPDGCDDAR